MEKNKITIERTLRSRSKSIIWELISTPAGLSRWIAEEVRQEGEELIFTWGKPGQEYETRRATVLIKVRNQSLRFRWEDEDAPSAYTEIALVAPDVADELALRVTDYAEPDDEESVTYMWNHDLDRLQYKMGV